MATKLYLPSTGNANIPTLNPSASWNVTTGFDRIWAVVSRISSSMASKTSGSPGASANQAVLNRQYVYGPIAAQTITGTVNGQVRGSESNANLDAVSAITIRVVAADGTVRGTLLALTYPALSGNEYTTSLVNRYTPVSGNVTQVTSQDGDYILIEIGAFCYASSNTRTVDQSFGDNSGTDLGANQTDTNTYNPFVNFSATISPYVQTHQGAVTEATAVNATQVGAARMPATLTEAAAVTDSVNAALRPRGDVYYRFYSNWR